jgi:hypothetical protein
MKGMNPDGELSPNNSRNCCVSLLTPAKFFPLRNFPSSAHFPVDCCGGFGGMAACEHLLSCESKENE